MNLNRHEEARASEGARRVTERLKQAVRNADGKIVGHVLSMNNDGTFSAQITDQTAWDLLTEAALKASCITLAMPPTPAPFEPDLSHVENAKENRLKEQQESAFEGQADPDKEAREIALRFWRETCGMGAMSFNRNVTLSSDGNLLFKLMHTATNLPNGDDAQIYLSAEQLDRLIVALVKMRPESFVFDERVSQKPSNFDSTPK